MSVLSFIQKPLKSFANYAYDLSKNPSGMLLFTGTFGWVLSAIAQVTGVVTNKKLSSDQKKFLIPQEIADAGVNIASFFLITKSCSAIGDKLVSKGKLLTPKIRGLLNTSAIQAKINAKDFKGLSNLAEIADKHSPKFNKELSGAYYNLADGVSFISSVAGSVLSCNIITPVLRNKIAADRQKQGIHKEQLMAQPKIASEVATLPTTPVLPMQNPYPQNTSLLAAYKPSASMKV